MANGARLAVQFAKYADHELGITKYFVEPATREVAQVMRSIKHGEPQLAAVADAFRVPGALDYATGIDFAQGAHKTALNLNALVDVQLAHNNIDAALTIHRMGADVGASVLSARVHRDRMGMAAYNAFTKDLMQVTSDHGLIAATVTAQDKLVAGLVAPQGERLIRSALKKEQPFLAQHLTNLTRLAASCPQPAPNAALRVVLRDLAEQPDKLGRLVGQIAKKFSNSERDIFRETLSAARADNMELYVFGDNATISGSATHALTPSMAKARESSRR